MISIFAFQTIARAQLDVPTDASCAKPAGSKTQLQQMEDLLAAMKKTETGDTQGCEDLTGIFVNSTDPKEKWSCDHPPKSSLVLMKMDGITELQSCSPVGKTGPSYLLFKDRGRFYRVTPNPKKHLPTLFLEPALLSAYQRKSQNVVLDAVEVDAKSVGFKTPDGKNFVYDGAETVHQFSKAHFHTVANATAFLDNQKVRVPLEMYELNQDPAFIEAKKNDQFTLMMDLIFKKAMVLSQGDVFEALFTSLLTTDVRNRGPCGAAFGLRGRTLVPRSIFDYEMSTIVEPSRLDATQHFFGYALMRLLTGGSVSPVISKVSKEKDYYVPITQNWFQRMHFGDDDGKYVNGDDDDAANDGTGWAGKTRAKERVRIDVDRDLFYNQLGIAFGRVLDHDKNALPSGTVNSAEFDPKRRKLGLYPSARKTPWAAFNPQLEVQGAFNDRDVPHGPDYETKIIEAASIREKVLNEVRRIADPRVALREKWQVIPKNELDILEFACIARNPKAGGEDLKVADMTAVEYRLRDQPTAAEFCDAYRMAMQAQVNEIYQKWHY